jgi:hypothetical protein
MKKIVAKEISFCDICKKPMDFGYDCAECGIEFCYECHKDRMIGYSAGVGWGGSGDIHYCKKCHDKLITSANDPIFEAYRKIFDLGQEGKRFYDDYKIRCNAAEKNLKKLLGV